MKFLDTLASLVGPLSNGFFQVLTGGLGLAVAVGGWLQVVVILVLAACQTSSIAGTIALALLLLFCQTAAALWSFLIANGSAYDRKASTIGSLTATAAISSGILVSLLAGLGSSIIAQFTYVQSVILVAATSTAMAAGSGALIVLVLYRLTQRK